MSREFDTGPTISQHPSPDSVWSGRGVGQLQELSPQTKAAIVLGAYSALGLLLTACDGGGVKDVSAQTLNDSLPKSQEVLPTNTLDWSPAPTPTLDLPADAMTKIIKLQHEMDLTHQCPDPFKLGSKLDGKFANPQIIGATCPGTDK